MAWLIDVLASAPYLAYTTRWLYLCESLRQMPQAAELAHRALDRINNADLTMTAMALGKVAASLPRHERHALVAHYEARLRAMPQENSLGHSVRECVHTMRQAAAGERTWRLTALPRRAWRTMTWPLRRRRERTEADALLEAAVAKPLAYRISWYYAAFKKARHCQDEARLRRCCAALLEEADSETFLAVWREHCRDAESAGWAEALAVAAFSHMASRGRCFDRELEMLRGPAPLCVGSDAVGAGLAKLALGGELTPLFALIERGGFSDADLEAVLAAPLDAAQKW